MDNRKQIETAQVSEEVKSQDSGRRTQGVKLVEMGQASVETKGYARGVEIGFTPKA